jgi:hypothetical protein
MDGIKDALRVAGVDPENIPAHNKTVEAFAREATLYANRHDVVNELEAAIHIIDTCDEIEGSLHDR